MTNAQTLRRLLLPLLLLIPVGWWTYTHLIAPGPWFMRQDPEAVYMMSSLSIFKGQHYVFVDHPGTPVQIIGTLLLAATYPFTAQGSFVLNHLQNPALFLMLARGFLTIISALCIALLLRYALPVKTWLDALTAAAVAISFYALDMWSIVSAAYWSHNAFNFPFGTLFLLLLLVMARNGQLCRPRNLWFVGALMGALTAIQLYFAAWVMGAALTAVMLYLLNGAGWRKVVSAGVQVGVASLAGFGVATLPIVPEYGRFVDWVLLLLFNQGIYGTGDPGIISGESLSDSLRTVMERPFFLLASVALIGGLMLAAIRQRHLLRKNAGLWAVAFGVSVQLVVVWLLILKHTAVIYLLAVAAVVPILLAVLLTLVGTSTLLARALRILVIVLVALAIGLNSFFATTFHNIQAEVARERSTVRQVIPPDQLQVGVLSDSSLISPCAALALGNHYSADVFTPEIETLCGG